MKSKGEKKKSDISRDNLRSILWFYKEDALFVQLQSGRQWELKVLLEECTNFRLKDETRRQGVEAFWCELLGWRWAGSQVIQRRSLCHQIMCLKLICAFFNNHASLWTMKDVQRILTRRFFSVRLRFRYGYCCTIMHHVLILNLGIKCMDDFE